MKRNHNNKKCMITAFSFCLLLTAICNNAVAQQQTSMYTQYMDNMTPLNPAYSLLDDAASVHALVRRQWVGIEGAPATYLLNANLPLGAANGTAGIIVYNNQLAIEHQTEVNAYFAKSVQLNSDSYLAVSLNGGIRNYAANYSTLDAADPSFRDDVRETKPNIGFGIMYYTDRYYLGVSAPELSITSLGTASVQNTANLSSHYYFSGACLIDLNEDIIFKPATLLSYARAVPFIANLSGTFYMKNTLGLGVNYRSDKILAGLFILNINDLRVGYSYQAGTSANLGGYNNATHEISIGYRFGGKGSQIKVL